MSQALFPTGFRATSEATFGKSTLNHVMKYERMLEEAHVKTDRKSRQYYRIIKKKRVYHIR
jgi:hypothetical protein